MAKFWLVGTGACMLSSVPLDPFAIELRPVALDVVLAVLLVIVYGSSDASVQSPTSLG